MKLLFLLLFLVSCGYLPYDSTPAPIDQNFWNLEMVYNGKRDQGLSGGVVFVPRELRVPVWHKGTLEIRSKRCSYQKIIRYEGEKDIVLSTEELMKNMPSVETSCIFNILLLVDGFDRGFQGQLHLIVPENDLIYPTVTIRDREYVGSAWAQIRQGSNFRQEIKIHNTGPGGYFFQGCGSNGEGRFNGDLTLQFQDFIKESKDCIYTLGLLYDDGRKGLVEFNFKAYSKDYINLPEPIITYEKDKLSVTADKIVGYVSIDKKYKKSNSMTAKVPKDVEVMVRYVTANGRLGLLGITNGVITWKPSVLY